MSGTAEIKVSHDVAPQEDRPKPDAEQVPAGRGNRRRLIMTLLAVIVVLACAALTWQLVETKRMNDPLPPVSSERALIVSRRVGVAFDDTQQTWRNWFRSRGLPTPRSAELVLYSNAQPTPCSGTSPMGGPFYCPLDDKASFDLVLLNQLEKRMDREAGLGTALIVARVVSEHIQGALGVPPAVAASNREDFSRMHTLQADCLTGVWAGLAKGRIGTVPPGFYRRLLSAGRLLTILYVNGGRPEQPALDIFLLDDLAAREAAFQDGFEARSPEACPRPT